MTMNQRAKLAISIGIPLIALAGILIYLVATNRDNPISGLFRFTPSLIKTNQKFKMRAVDTRDYMTQQYIGMQAWLCETDSTNLDRKNKIVACNDRKAFESFMKSFVANDEHGIAELVRSGEAIYVEPQTSCKIIKVHSYVNFNVGSEFEVRILEGPHEGKAVFVFVSFVCINEQT